MRARGKLHKSFYPKRSQDELQSDIETYVSIRHNQYGMSTNIPLIFPKLHEHMNLVVRTLQEKSTEQNGVGPELVRFSFLVIQTHLLMLMRSVRLGAKASMVINQTCCLVERASCRWHFALFVLVLELCRSVHIL